MSQLLLNQIITLLNRVHWVYFLNFITLVYRFIYMLHAKCGFVQSMDWPSQSRNSDWYFAQQNYGFFAQLMDCPLGSLHKVLIRQTRSCFILRSLLILSHTKLAIAIYVYSYVQLYTQLSLNWIHMLLQI